MNAMSEIVFGDDNSSKIKCIRKRIISSNFQE